VRDSNGAMSYGLAQWNTASYPDAASLVTGNPAADAAAQVTYFAQTGGINQAAGSTPQQAAASLAQNYERCSTCQTGGAQNTTRQAQAVTVAGWASSGQWPSATQQAADTAQLTAAQGAGSDATCLWSVGYGGIPGTSWLRDIFGSGGNVLSGEICLLAKSQARGVEAAGLMLAGGIIMGLGVVLMVAGAELTRPAGQSLAAKVPGVGLVAALGSGPGTGTAGKAAATSPSAASPSSSAP
jgi:hypothetical protein